MFKNEEKSMAFPEETPSLKAVSNDMFLRSTPYKVNRLLISKLFQ